MFVLEAQVYLVLKPPTPCHRLTIIIIHENHTVPAMIQSSNTGFLSLNLTSQISSNWPNALENYEDHGDVKPDSFDDTYRPAANLGEEPLHHHNLHLRFHFHAGRSREYMTGSPSRRAKKKMRKLLKRRILTVYFVRMFEAQKSVISCSLASYAWRRPRYVTCHRAPAKEYVSRRFSPTLQPNTIKM